MTNSYFSQGFKPPTSIGGLIREAGVWSLSSLSSGSFGSLTGWVNTYEIQASTGCLNMVNWKVLALKSPLSKMMHGGYCRVGQNHTHSIPINHNQKYEQYDRLIHMNQLGFMLLSHWGLEIYTWAYPHLSANECDFYGTSHDPEYMFHCYSPSNLNDEPFLSPDRPASGSRKAKEPSSTGADTGGANPAMLLEKLWMDLMRDCKTSQNSPTSKSVNNYNSSRKRVWYWICLFLLRHIGRMGWIRYHPNPTDGHYKFLIWPTLDILVLVVQPPSMTRSYSFGVYYYSNSVFRLRGSYGRC